MENRIIGSIASLPDFAITEFRAEWVLRTATLKKANRPAIADAIIVSTAMSAKAALNNAMLEARISRTELAARLGVDEKVVRRLLDPKHQSHIRTVLNATALLGLEVEVRFDRAT
jgi:hypothetical protein